MLGGSNGDDEGVGTVHWSHVGASVEDSDQRGMTQNRREESPKGKVASGVSLGFRVTWMGERSGTHGNEHVSVCPLKMVTAEYSSPPLWRSNGGMELGAVSG